MAAPVVVPVEKYLSTSFDGSDREYVHGEVVERSMGGVPHGDVQGQIVFLFRQVRRQQRWKAVVELRLRLNPDLYRIPDVCVYWSEPPNGDVPSNPPDVAIEVLSPDDRHANVMSKFEEYREFGIPHIWLVDPQRRRLSVFDAAGLRSVDRFELPGRAFQMTPDEIFETS